MKSYKNVNKEIVMEILSKLPQNKKLALKKSLERNLYLTSSYILNDCVMTVYKQGWYVALNGTRCSFSVFAYDNDGDYIIASKKPHEKQLDKLYTDNSIKFCERDFFELQL